jgi:hypothetical protein
MAMGTDHPLQRAAAHRRHCLGLAACTSLLFVSLGALAQLAPQDPDWKEIDLPPPSSFSRDKLIPLEMPRYAALKFGIDPATLSVSSDRIVRYVVVATSSTGVVNAMYEGLRCDVSEFKTLARWSAKGEWVLVKDPSWRPLNDNNTSRHALALARQGACEGRTAAASSAEEIVRRLKAPASIF